MVKRVIEHMPPVKSVMTPFPYFVEATDTVTLARRMMDRHRIRHLPVMRDGRLEGIISDRDIKYVLDPKLGRPSDPELRVEDAHVSRAYVVELSERLDQVLSHMARNHLGSALVVKHGKLAGIFTMTDACRSFAEFLRSIFPEGGGNSAA